MKIAGTQAAMLEVDRQVGAPQKLLPSLLVITLHQSFDYDCRIVLSLLEEILQPERQDSEPVIVTKEETYHKLPPVV
jgi:hypothetical protein